MDNKSSLAAELGRLEQLLATPEIRRSPEQLARLLADEFREFGSSGRVFDKGQIIAELQRQQPCELLLRDFEAVPLAPDIVLLTYRGTARFPGSGLEKNSLRSSLWRRRDGRWEVIFHQGTPTGEPSQA